MASADTDMAHTTQDIWQQINTQAASIGEIRSAQATTDARLDSIERSVESGFHTLTTELQRISGRVYAPPKETSPTAVIGASAAIIFGVLGMFGAYTMLITAPIKANLENLRVTVHERSNIVSEFHGTKAVVEHLVRDVERLEEFRSRAERALGRQEELIKRVEDIDSDGSRAWNGVRKSSPK